MNRSLRRSPVPPRLATRLLEITAPEADLDCMLGDLEEEFMRRLEHSETRAPLVLAASTPIDTRQSHP